MEDKTNLKILRLLVENSKTSLHEIGRKVGIFSPSAVSRRIKEMENRGVITRNTVILDPNSLDINFMTVTFVRAHYSKEYQEILGEKLRSIRGVVSVYFLLGDIDFVLITLSKNKEEYGEILKQLMEIPEIERTDTRTVLKVFRENDYESIVESLIDRKE